MCLPRVSLLSLWIQEWVRDFPFLLQRALVSILHRLPNEHCLVTDYAIGNGPNTVGVERVGAHSLCLPKVGSILVGQVQPLQVTLVARRLQRVSDTKEHGKTPHPSP